MGSKILTQTTANRSTFNRIYKAYLEQQGEIFCSCCPYHKHENCDNKYYGGYYRTNGHLKMRYPNWKLVSKNPKQWMTKPIKTKIKTNLNGQWFNIVF